MRNPFEPPSFLWKAPGGRLCHGRGMVAARQFPYLRVERAGYRFSKSTKSSDFQTPQMSFFKAKKATKKTRWHLENVNYYYSIQRVFLGWDVRRSFERIFFKAVALDFQRFFVVGKLSRSFWMDPKEQQKLMLRLLSEAGQPWDVYKPMFFLVVFWWEK